VWDSALLDPAHRAASVEAAPVNASSLIRWMTLQTHPRIHLPTALWHLAGWGIAGMPLLGKSGVVIHRPARAECEVLTGTVRADCLGSIPSCQILNLGLPLMVPAASVDAARAEQRDFLFALVGELGRHTALVPGRVQDALDVLVIWMC